MRYLILAAILLLTMCAVAATADSVSSNFDTGYVSGSISGQNGWFVQYPGTEDESVTAGAGLSGSAAWRISNYYSNGIVVHAASPSLSQVAGDSTRPGLASALKTFHSDFWWKTASTTGDNSMVQISPDDGSGSRWGGRLDITNFSSDATFDGHTVQAGVHMDWDTIVNDTDRYISSPALVAGAYYHTVIQVVFVPGVTNPTTPNDVVTIKTYDASGNLVWTVDPSDGASTWELAGYGGTGAVDRLVWRTRWNTSQVTGNGFSADHPAGFYFDDVSVSSLAGTLSLDPTVGSIYVKPISKDPASRVVVNLDVSNLAQPVAGLQAMLNFSSTYFKSGTSDVNVVAGGGVWDELIWNKWNTSGDLDVAVGVKLDLAGGTQANATTAVVTLQPIAEGQTTVVFRPDAVPDEGLTKSTFLTDMSGNPVWPGKADSATIYIDGTAPVVTSPGDKIVSTDPGLCSATVSVGTATATDENSGLAGSVVGVRDDSQPLTASYPKGVTHILWSATDKAGNTGSCIQTITVNDTEPPVITGPANVTVHSGQPTDPPATGVATATDNCGAVTITYNDNRSGLGHCGGNIIRTWTATDSRGNFSTCTQTITLVNDALPVIFGCPGDISQHNDPGLCSAVVNWTAPTALETIFSEGFEDAAFTSGNYVTQPSVDWNDYSSHVYRAASGTDGIVSKSGSAYGVIDSTSLPTDPDYNYSGAFCRLHGYDAVFGIGFKTSVDVYLDLSNPAVTAGTYGWDCSCARDSSSGDYGRDYIFHVAGHPGQFVVGAGNGSNDAPPADFGGIAAGSHATLTTSGWYTFEWDFKDNGSGAVAVDLNLKNASGTQLWSQTLCDPTDAVSASGGNRYMWFTFLAVDKLAIDNTTLLRKVPVVCSPASGSVFESGTTAVTCTATDSCGNSSHCSFNVTVTDAEAPTVTSASASPALVKNQDVTITAAGTDNCTPAGSLTWKHKVGSGSWVDGLAVANSELAEGVNTLYVKATDAAGNTSADFTVTNTVRKDTTAPTISISDNLGANPVLQGTYTITVTANDGGSGLAGAPVVKLDGAVLSGSGSGPWTYTVPVTATTANGAHTITADISDQAGNAATQAVRTFTVNKNQITGTITSDFIGGGKRTVTFYLNGTTMMTADVASDGVYKLVNVPDNVTAVSAKTNWTLRKKLTGLSATDGQIVANFTLLGGDMDNNNSINVLDYSVLKLNWLRLAAGNPADINGDGVVNNADYQIMLLNWFKVGDAK